MGVADRRNTGVIIEHSARPSTGKAKVLKDEYTFVRRLGSGGQGETALVKRQRDGKFLVRKAQEEFDMQGNTPTEMLIFEQVLTPHPSIVRFDHCNFTKTTGTLILYFEHCEGGDLTRYLPTRDHTPEAFIWHVFIQLTEALQFLHYGIDNYNTTPPRGWRRVVHRDIKPANIFLRRSVTSHNHVPKVVLGDFGLATLSERSGYCGTAEWLAPEIIRGDKVTKQGDVWGLGAVIHALAHGEGPEMKPPSGWPKHRSDEWYLSAKARKPRPMSTIYSSALNRNMMDCLKMDPCSRVTSKELLRNLYKEKPRGL